MFGGHSPAESGWRFDNRDAAHGLGYRSEARVDCRSGVTVKLDGKTVWIRRHEGRTPSGTSILSKPIFSAVVSALREAISQTRVRCV